MVITLSTVLLLGLTATAAVTDIVYHKIYNWTTYPGIAAALVVNYFENGWNDHYPGLEDSLQGLAVCGGLMLVSYVLFSVGGGDVKLMAMLGAFLGLEKGLEALLWTFVLGAAAGLTVLIWRVGFFRLVGRSMRHVLLSLRLVSWLPLSEEERRQLQLPLYLARFAGMAVVIVTFDLTRFL
ncbi:MAG TPA: A24 family peptidase [Planctomycetaceae bacterium]|nr:A24 family peptidase [Planctomycetaceae bacterium]